MRIALITAKAVTKLQSQYRRKQAEDEVFRIMVAEEKALLQAKREAEEAAAKTALEAKEAGDAAAAEEKRKVADAAKAKAAVPERARASPLAQRAQAQAKEEEEMDGVEAAGKPPTSTVAAMAEKSTKKRGKGLLRRGLSTRGTTRTKTESPERGAAGKKEDKAAKTQPAPTAAAVATPAVQPRPSITTRKASIFDAQEEEWEKKPKGTPMTPAGTDLDKPDLAGPKARRASMVAKPVIGEDHREEWEKNLAGESKGEGEGQGEEEEKGEGEGELLHGVLTTDDEKRLKREWKTQASADEDKSNAIDQKEFNKMVKKLLRDEGERKPPSEKDLKALFTEVSRAAWYLVVGE